MLVSQAISSLPGGSASYDNGIVRFHQNAEWHHHHHHQAELVGGAYSFVVVFCFCLSSHCWLKSEIPSRDVSLLIDLRKKKEKHQCDWLIISPRSAFLPSFLLSINHPPTPPSPGGRCSNPLIGFLLYDSASSQEQREHHQSSSRSRVASQPDGNQTFYFIFLVLGNPLF